MITYVKVCYTMPEVAGGRGEGQVLNVMEFVVKDYEHLVSGDALRVRPCVVSCDFIDVIPDIGMDPTKMGVVVRTGKATRNFHFNNVIFHEVDESET